ncbi:MAG: hypothetical protein ACOYL6_05655 [Bacteriovoracaceae bacterium]
MKKFLIAIGVVMSTCELAQTRAIDPYRVGFQNPLEFSANTKLNVQKIKLNTVDGTWAFKGQDDQMFN